MSSDCPKSHPSVCQCQQPVADVPPHGAALWARTEAVASLLAGRFAADPTNPSVFIARDADWPAQMAAFLEQLSPIDAASILAAPLDEAGGVDPWTAMPALGFVQRAQTPWLATLLNERRLIAYLQPIVDLRTERVVAFEALMRAELDGRIISAGQIIEAARAHNALFQFDQQAREAAIRQGWPQLQPGQKLFINFAPTVIYDPIVCLKTTWQAAKEVGCDLQNLVFEVVESETFPKLDHLHRILDTYREHGAQVALDDLGSGNTALTFIDKLQPDLIKLDRKLLPLEPTPGSLRLLEGLVDYAHGRGIKVLVEGVETQAQYEAARSIKVDLAQGYLLGRPAPKAEQEVASRQQATGSSG